MNNHKKFTVKSNGLIKKTISVTIDHRVHHLVCYYSQEEFIQGKINDPKGMEMTLMLRQTEIPTGITLNNNFRRSKDEERPRSVSCFDVLETSCNEALHEALNSVMPIWVESESVETPSETEMNNAHIDQQWNSLWVGVDSNFLGFENKM